MTPEEVQRAKDEAEGVAALVGHVAASQRQMNEHIISESKDLSKKAFDSKTIVKNHITDMRAQAGVPQAPPAAHVPPMAVPQHIPPPTQPPPQVQPAPVNIPVPQQIIHPVQPAPVIQQAPMDITPILIKLDKLENEVNDLKKQVVSTLDDLKLTYEQLTKKLNRDPKSITIKFDEATSTEQKRVSKSVPSTDRENKRVRDRSS